MSKIEADDMIAVRELELFAENDGDLYRAQILPTLKNFARKIKQGTYDPDLALIQWKRIADSAAKRYNKEFDIVRKGYGAFTPKTRTMVAHTLSHFFSEELADMAKVHKNPHSIHTAKFDKCVRDVRAKGSAYNPYAVCMSSLGEREAVRAGHRRKNPHIVYVICAENIKTGQLAYFTGHSIDTERKKAKAYRTLKSASAAFGTLHLPKGWIVSIKERGARNPLGEKLYQDFHGEPFRHVKRQNLPHFTHGVEVGRVVSLAYETLRDGERAIYEHDFKKRAAPDLVASADGRALGLTGGAYRFTDRGIVDSK
ncbi:MAG: hypothetical protein ACRESO_00280 [Gammaproteobacteria bacterium]